MIHKLIAALCLVALVGCSSVAVPGYTVTLQAASLGPIAVGAVSVAVQPHVDTFRATPTPSPTPDK